MARWGQLDNRELPPDSGTENGHRLHFVDGGVLDNRPFSYTIREIYYRTAYRPVERKLFYIDPSPDQFLGSPKFNRMAKPNIWETISDSLVTLPRYESISNDLQEIKERNERVLRYKFLRATAERVGEYRQTQVQQKLAPDTTSQLVDSAVDQDSDQQKIGTNPPTPEEIYLRCRLVGMRDRILPLLLRIDRASVPNRNNTNQDDQQNQNRQALLESAAQLITKYITDKEQQKKREDFLHNLGKEIRNLDVNYALRKHFFLLGKICQCMGNSQYHDKEKYPNLHKELKQLAENLSRQVELLEVIQVALEEMLQSELVSRTFYALLDRTQKKVLLSKVGSRSQSAAQIADIRKETRWYIYDYLLRLHRFLLDADGLTDPNSNPNRLAQNGNPYLIDEPDDKEKPTQISAEFFKDLPVPISPAQISGVLLLLREKAKQLDFAKLGLKAVSGEDDQLDLEKSGSIWKQDKYKFVEGYENNSTAYWSILYKVELASEKLINSCNVTSVAELLLKSFQSFRYVDEEVYSYEYLSDIQAKEQIEIVRISPEVAQFGYGKGKGLEEKLAGDQLGAFGGFFKKSWRSNDILWGRFDGLNRIVEALLTPSALKNFSSFLSRQLDDKEQGSEEEKMQKYLNKLVDEALPEATESERTSIIQNLAKLAVPDQTLEGEALTSFLDTIVTVGQRAILKTDLGNVLEDAIAEQLDWSHQLIGSKKSFGSALKVMMID